MRKVSFSEANYAVSGDSANQWQIMAEEVLEEDDHIYEIIVAEPSIVPFTYNDRELKFGPFLLEQDQPAFRKEWLAELEREQVAIEQMKKLALKVSE